MNAHELGAAAPPDPTAAIHAAPAVATLRFHGATACGVVGLTLERDPECEGPVTGPEQVLRLAQAEPLVREVEAWLQSPWDPEPWLPAVAEDALPDYQAVVRDPALAPPGTVLHVPLGALLVPPPNTLRPPATVWAVQVADTLLAQLSNEVLEQLEAGALVWLPAALGPDWNITLRDPSGRLPPCAARLDLAAQRLLVLGGAASTGLADDEPAGQDLPAPDVRLGQRVRVPLDQWLGWGKPGAAPFKWPVPQPWTAELRHQGVVRARGTLAPMGRGCGLLIETIEAGNDTPIEA